MGTVEYHLYQANNSTLVGQLTPQTHGIQVEEDRPSFQKVGHDAGPASFALPLDSPIIPQRRQVVRVKLVDEDLEIDQWWNAWRIVGVKPRPVNPNEEVGELLTVTLRELLVDDERAVVQRNVPVWLRPAFAERVEGWMGPTFTETADWVDATPIAVQGWASTFFTGLPSGWTDPEALWISDAFGDDDDAPDDSTRWLRHTITPSAASSNAVLQLSGDNYVKAWWNGHELGDHGDFREHRQFELGPMTNDEQLLAVLLYNAPDDGPPGGNPTAAIWTLRDGIDGPVIARSDDSVQVLPYNETAPTTSDGEALVKLFADSPNLASRVCTFDELEDSGGTPWPRLEMLKMQTGGTVAAHLRDRTDVAIDFEHHYDGSFSAWVKGGRGSVVDVDLFAARSTAGEADPAGVNLNDLEWELDDTKSFDALLVQNDDGYLIRPWPLSGGETFGFLKVSGTGAEATAVADGILAAYGAGLEVATIDYVPPDASGWPGVAFDVWDVVPVPTADDLDTTENQRVRAVTLRINEAGDPEWIVELGSLWMERVELLERRAQSDNGVNRVESAQPLTLAAARIAPPRVSTLIVGDFAIPTMDAPDSGIYQFPYTCRVVWLRVTAKTPGGTTSLTVSRNGGTVSTLSLGSSDTADFDDAVDLVTTTTDEWELDLTAVGDHTRVTVTAGVAPIGT